MLSCAYFVIIRPTGLYKMASFSLKKHDLLLRERSALATIIFTLVSVCQDVRMSVRIFKMLLLRKFLSDYADF